MPYVELSCYVPLQQCIHLLKDDWMLKQHSHRLKWVAFFPPSGVGQPSVHQRSHNREGTSIGSCLFCLFANTVVGLACLQMHLPGWVKQSEWLPNTAILNRSKQFFVQVKQLRKILVYADFSKTQNWYDIGVWEKSVVPKIFVSIIPYGYNSNGE